MSNINVNLNFSQALMTELAIEGQIVKSFEFFRSLRKDRKNGDRHIPVMIANQVHFVKELNKVRRELKAHKVNVLNKACESL